MTTMLARSVKLLLTNLSPKVTNDNDKLPEDILWEIFGAYRELYELQPDCDTLWNSIDGWMKLTHVCLHWRRVVLSSSTHLRLRLLFTPRRSSKAPILKSLPGFPILVDYGATTWTEEEEALALAALRHPRRVRGINLRGPCPPNLLRALKQPFPELESLQIGPAYDSDYHRELVLPSTLLSGSAPRLQRLTLREVAPACLSPLLSYTTGLVELTITVCTGDSSPPIPSLIPNLRRMSSLRRLELKLIYRPDELYRSNNPPVTARAGDGVPLPKLTQFIFSGHRLYLQELVVGLATPSLQHFTATLLNQARDAYTTPHLCKFMKDTECQFTAVRLTFTRSNVEFYGSRSLDDQHFRITVPVPNIGPFTLDQLGQELSGSLSTVEDLVIAWDVERWNLASDQRPVEWRPFFDLLPQVKSLQVPGEVAIDIAHSFQQDGPEPVLEYFPDLQRLEVRSLVGEGDQYADIRDAFGPLVAARQKADCPIKFSWSLWSYQDKEKWLVR